MIKIENRTQLLVPFTATKNENCLIKGYDYKDLCAADRRAPFPDVDTDILGSIRFDGPEQG